MTEHLLLVAIGPVQDFIAQARRTRDLWHGSHLISELSRAVARSLSGSGARLLVPALDPGDLGLVECWTPIRPTTGAPPDAVANKIWALVPTHESPRRISELARDALKQCMREQAAKVWAKLGEQLPVESEAVWHEQVDDALEFVAGWLAIGDRAFGEVRAELDDAVSARKRLRDFRPWTQQRGSVRKSSLDGARETVLPDARKRPRQRAFLQRKFGLGESEELDAIGLIKRAGAEPEHFIPLVNVALAPWLAWATRHHEAAVEACRSACRDLGVQRIDSPTLADDFRFEASILLPDRWPALEREQGYDEPKRQTQWEATKAAVLGLRRTARAPQHGPYVACLIADGDRMGEAINRLSDPEGFRRFSGGLSTFAKTARTIVSEHSGSLVYAGGDDVLAFVPVSTALACADALRRRFVEIVGPTCRALNLVDDDHPAPSLSVGIGVGHFMQSMGELLELGRDAEKLAKGSALPKHQQRNALAIIVDKRSGGRRSWRLRWPADPCGRLAEDIALIPSLSTTKIHEIATTVRRLPKPGPKPPKQKQRDALSSVLELEVARSLARNEGEALSFTEVGLSLPVNDYFGKREAVLRWIDRLLIARELHRADPLPRSRPEAT
ncbi:CRISPR-associated protein [Enhygromyxa salina]|uniref:CRISPR-associated protein n=1 Tax=Enhygromyxa salina TaxID=215803 RepID=A0A2S9XEX0_9BACT|nr:type III-B CRISPR-associated protein Cas10/Cmr2 [Enhygromyxa salina]PRP91418.1 CRISPR-associated protein [Enhygromyxa salina]